jgi:hypothetical protein
MPAPIARRTRRLALLALACAAPLPAAPAQPPSPSCLAPTERRQAAEALRAADADEARLRAAVAANPRDADALVALATVLVRCRVPFAELAAQGQLAGEGVELLQRALEIEPRHWLARFTLGAVYFRMPSFLGRAGDAARELDRLIADHGGAPPSPALARAFEMRGVLHARAGRADSARAVWRRGAVAFPADTALARLAAPGAPAVPPPAAPRQPNDSAARAASLGAVRVVAARGAPAGATAPQATLGRLQVLTTPGAMADVFQAVQLQPGATRATEGSDVYTRGGDPSETPVVVDGGRMLAASRFEGLGGGLFGALDPAVLRAVRYSSGGFSARHGNALSGVLDVETEGRARTRRTRAGLNISQLGATVHAPVGDAARRTGAWGTVRATNATALLRLHDRTAEFESSPWSVEAMGGVVAEPRVGTELRAVALVERDASARVVDAGGLVAPFRSEGGSRLLALSGRTLATRLPAVARASVALSDRSSVWEFGAIARDRREGSAIARLDVDWTARADGPFPLTVRAGGEGGALARRERGRIPTTARWGADAPSAALASDGSAGQVGGYVEGELGLGGALSVSVGARVDRLPGEDETTADPRASLAWRAGVWTARLGGGVYHQGRWRAATALPAPGVPSGVPTEARHLVAGVERAGPVRWRAEAYHKGYSRYAPTPVVGGGAASVGPAVASGSAQGLDLLAQRDVAGRVTGWLGYSFLRGRLRLADGREVRSAVDVTHAITAVAKTALGGDFSLGATARYATGVPITPVVGVVAGDGGRPAPVYGVPHGSRVPDYARLDLRLMRAVPLRNRLLTAYVEALNVLDRPNASGYAYDAHYRSRRPVETFFASRTFVVGAEVGLP